MFNTEQNFIIHFPVIKLQSNSRNGQCNVPYKSFRWGGIKLGQDVHFGMPQKLQITHNLGGLKGGGFILF